jgi:hypothetical protein
MPRFFSFFLLALSMQVDIEFHQKSMELLDPARTIVVAAENISRIEDLATYWESTENLEWNGHCNNFEACIIAYGKLVPILSILKKSLLSFITKRTPSTINYSSEFMQAVYALVRFDYDLVDLFDVYKEFDDIIVDFYCQQILCIKVGYVDQEKEDLIQSRYTKADIDLLFTQ